MLATILLLSVGAEPVPTFTVANKLPQFTVVNKIDPTGEGPNPHTPYDPYGHGTYESFNVAVQVGGRGILVVGVEDKYVGSYHIHFRAPSGFKGYADGEYDFWMEGGVLRSKARPKDAPAGKAVSRPVANPFGPAANGPATTAPSATGSNSTWTGGGTGGVIVTPVQTRIVGTRTVYTLNGGTPTDCPPGVL